MIDPIGTKAASAGDLRIEGVKADAAVAKVAEIAQAKAQPSSAKTVTLGASAAARTLAASPPVDHERVAQIRKAVQEGRFPLYPATVADRLIAFEQGWRTQ